MRLLNYRYAVGKMATTDLVLRAETAAAQKAAAGTAPITPTQRLELFLDTYADSEAAMNFLVGDAAHDFGNYIATTLANYGGVTLADLAKHLQAVRRGERGRLPAYQLPADLPPLPAGLYNKDRLERDIDTYSTSKGESNYLDFLKDARGDSRLTLKGTFNLRDPAQMEQLLSGCNNYIIDATYGNPFKFAANNKTVYDLITGKTDAGSGLGPNAVGRARYVSNTEDFTIINYFYGIPLKFGVVNGLPYMEMDLRSINPILGKRTVRLPKGASVNALCEALGVPGIRNEGNAGSKVRLTVTENGAPYAHPFDFLFKTGTDLGTLLQSIYLEIRLGLEVGTLTNDRFFKERAAEFERPFILFTPDARSHTAQLWSSKKQPPLTPGEQGIIRGRLLEWDFRDAPAEVAVIERIQAIIDILGDSCISSYIKAELENIFKLYRNDPRAAELGERDRYIMAKAAASSPENAPGAPAAANFYNTYRNLLATTVKDLLKLFITDKLLKLQDEILQFKTTIASAFGRFKSANADEASGNKRKTIFKIIKNAVERIYVAPAAAGGGAPPSKEQWVATTLAALSSNFVGTYGNVTILGSQSQGVLNSSSVPTATGYVCTLLGASEPAYTALFSGARMMTTVPQDANYIKVINIVSKMIEAPPAAAAGGSRSRRSRRKAKRGSRRVQRGGDINDEYPQCLLETDAADPNNFYPALVDPAAPPFEERGIKAPINDVNLLFTFAGTFNVLIFTHAVLYALIEDFHGNNTGVLVESSLMDLVEIYQAGATNAHLVTHIRFLLYDYDAIIPTLISRLSTEQLGILAHPDFITEARIEAARAPETARYFSLIGQGTPIGQYELEPWKLLLLGVVPEVVGGVSTGGLVRDQDAAAAIAGMYGGAVAAINADITARVAEDTAEKARIDAQLGELTPAAHHAIAEAAAPPAPLPGINLEEAGAGGGGGGGGGGASSGVPGAMDPTEEAGLEEWRLVEEAPMPEDPKNTGPKTPLVKHQRFDPRSTVVTYLVPTKEKPSPPTLAAARFGGPAVARKGAGAAPGQAAAARFGGPAMAAPAGAKRKLLVVPEESDEEPGSSSPTSGRRTKLVEGGARKTRRKRNKNKGRKTRRS